MMSTEIQCPKCQSEDMIFSPKRQVHICEDCAHEFAPPEAQDDPVEKAIFISAVSSEFHMASKDHESYRYILDQAFGSLAPHYKVITQEEFKGVADSATLLEFLDEQVSCSDLVIHLVGHSAGARPTSSRSIRRILEIHPDFLESEPEVAQDLNVEELSFTQWEFYLALHHQSKNRQKPHCFVFEASSEALRAPDFEPADPELQGCHRKRLGTVVESKIADFYDPEDLARKAIRSFLRHGYDPKVELPEPARSAIEAAQESREKITKEVRQLVKKNGVSGGADSSNIKGWIDAIRSVANKWEVNLRTIADIVMAQEDYLKTRAETNPSFENWHEWAFVSLSSANYQESRVAARKAADAALLEMKSHADKNDQKPSRDQALDALELLADAAEMINSRSLQISAMEEAGALVNQEKEPLLWADIHQPLAKLLLDQGVLARCKELVDDLVDIREEHNGEDSLEVAETLLLWGDLLKELDQYADAVDVARRAENIFYSATPPELQGVSNALNLRALALMDLERLDEAEELLRRVLEITENIYGQQSVEMYSELVNLALVVAEQAWRVPMGQRQKKEIRIEEAEKLYRQAFSLENSADGLTASFNAKLLNNFAVFLHKKGGLSSIEKVEQKRCLAEAEEIFIRALALGEAADPNSLDVAVRLDNYALLLADTGRLVQAETFHRRALDICEKVNPESALVSTKLNNLACLLAIKKTASLPEDAVQEKEACWIESEELYRRALVMDERFRPDSLVMATHLKNLAWVLEERNGLDESEALNRRVLAIQEKIYGPESSILIHTLRNLAWLISRTGRAVESEQLYRRALDIGEKVCGAEAPEVVDTLYDLAKVFYDHKRLEESEALYRQTLAIWESQDPESSTVAGVLNRLGWILEDTGRLQEAEECYRRTLAINEQECGSDSAIVAIILDSIAAVLKKSNQPEVAVHTYRRLLAIKEKVYGVESPGVANTLYNLARVLYDGDQLEEAEALYRRALSVEESLNPLSGCVSGLLSRLGWICEDVGRVKEAEAYYRRTLAIDEKVYGSDSLIVSETLKSLARVLCDTDQFEEAEELYRRALIISEQEPGLEEVGLADILYDLSVVLYRSGKLAEAEEKLRRALTIEGSLAEKNLKSIVNLYEYLSMVLRETGRLDESLLYCQQALEGSRKIFGEDSVQVANFSMASGIILYEQEHVAEAAGSFEKAKELHERHSGEGSREVAECAHALGLVCRDLKRYSEAEAHLKQAVRIYQQVFGKESKRVAVGQKDLGLLFVDMDRFSEAEMLLVSALPVLERECGDDVEYIVSIRKTLGEVREKLI